MVESGWRDKGWGIFFWMHFMGIVVLALKYGLPAVKRDGQSTEDDPNRDALDFNASLFFRVVLYACLVGAGMSALMLTILSRAAGSLIKLALYASLFLQAAMVATMMTISIIFGVLLLIPLLLTAWYIYAVRPRIPFAAAHVEIAVQATKAHSGVYMFAFFMVFVQCTWVILWSLAALGVENIVNNGSNAEADTVGPTSSKQTRIGGILVFAMLVSLLWGVQVFKYVCHFVVAAVTGHWWYLASPSAPVKGSIYRAFTSSFGSLALGGLIVAVLEALRRFAKAVMQRAEQRGNNALALLACLVLCIIGCVESLIAYLNIWAVIQCALTGKDFRTSGHEAWELFRKRGFTAIINDDLVGTALQISSIMIGMASAVVGGGLVYIAMPSSPSRAVIAGLGAALCFFVGIGMSGIMLGVISSSVRTVFVCFAMNPHALASTHPEALTKIVNAWNTFHPRTFNDCGYGAQFSGTVPAGSYSPAYASAL